MTKERNMSIPEKSQTNLQDEAVNNPQGQKKSIFSILRKGQNKGSHEPSQRDSLQGILVVILILMGLQVIMSGYQIYRDLIMERAQAIDQAVVKKSVSNYTANLDQLTNQMLSDYKANVYNNPKVDTTSKQQVLGTEYNFNAIMLLIKQNSRLMELVAQSQ
jgi:hypothetical protein